MKKKTSDCKKWQKQRTKINPCCSTIAGIVFSVLQGSILRPLIFNTYIFLENSDIDIAIYADDNGLYACSSNLDTAIFKHQKNIERSFRWFDNNNLISNAEKSHLFVSSKENLEIQASNCSIRNENGVKLLEIHINNNLNLDHHVNQLCKKTNKKLHALARIAKYIDINKQRMIMKTFISS